MSTAVRPAPHSGSPARLWLLLALAALAVAAALLGAARWVRSRLAPEFALQLAAELETAPEGELPALVERLDALGEPALPALAAAAGSARPAAAQAAQTRLLDRVDAWRRLPRAESSHRAAALARALAEQTPQRDPAAHPFAARLAAELLLWPLDEDAAATVRFVSDCETVLAAASRAAPREDLARAEAASPAALARPPAVDLRAGAGWDELSAAALPYAPAEPEFLPPALAEPPPWTPRPLPPAPAAPLAAEQPPELFAPEAARRLEPGIELRRR